MHFCVCLLFLQWSAGCAPFFWVGESGSLIDPGVRRASAGILIVILLDLQINLGSIVIFSISSLLNSYVIDASIYVGLL